MDARAYLVERSVLVDRELDAVLPAAGAPPASLHGAMRHLVFPGGKRLRPGLALAAAEAVGSPPDVALPIATAVELVHTWSLIHDDLPCMDDDVERRGRAHGPRGLRRGHGAARRRRAAGAGLRGGAVPRYSIPPRCEARSDPRVGDGGRQRVPAWSAARSTISAVRGAEAMRRSSNPFMRARPPHSSPRRSWAAPRWPARRSR